MSHDLQVLLRTLQLQAGQDGETPAPTDGETPELPVPRVRGENGEVYFNLDWQTRQADERQQRTNESYQTQNFPPDDSAGDNPGFSNFRHANSNNPSPSAGSNNAPDADGNHLYQADSNTNSFINTRGNSSHGANNYANNNSANNYSNSGTHNYGNNNSANNYSNNNAANNFLNDSRTVNWLQNQPENLRERIVRMAEPRVVEVRIEGRIETGQISRFDELAQKMQSLKLTPREFANTLPREEREAFLARFQLTQTTNGERLPQANNDKFSLENKLSQPSENQAGKFAAQTAAQNKNAGNPSTRIVEENTFGTLPQNASNKSAEISKNIVSADKTFIALPDANPKTAFPAANFSGAELLNARGLNHNAAENAVMPNISNAREAGVVLGGALINGAFAAAVEYEQNEQNRVGDASGHGNFYGAGALGFAAGATGSLLSAAIGRVIPGAGTDVGGVLGFVSGVVVGVEIDEGFRWLGAAKNALPAAENFQLNNAEEMNINSNLLLGFA